MRCNFAFGSNGIDGTDQELKEKDFQNTETNTGKIVVMK
jgi:hypothetical protein